MSLFRFKIELLIFVRSSYVKGILYIKYVTSWFYDFQKIKIKKTTSQILQFAPKATLHLHFSNAKHCCVLLCFYSLKIIFKMSYQFT